MGKRSVAICGGLILLVGVPFGKESAVGLVLLAVHGPAAVVGAIGAWGWYRIRNQPLTWRPLTATTVVAAAISGPIVALSPLDLISFISGELVGRGMGNGLAVGLALSLVNYGLRGPLPDSSTGSEPDPTE